METSSVPLARENVSVGPRERSITIWNPISHFTLVAIAIREEVHAVTIWLVKGKLAYVPAATWPLKCTLPGPVAAHYLANERAPVSVIFFEDSIDWISVNELSLYGVSIWISYQFVAGDAPVDEIPLI